MPIRAGLVRSQVIEAADGSVRFVLNASQSPRTQSSRFLGELFGSGVQHIAFATDDLPATVERLERNGVQLAGDPGELLRRSRGQDRPAGRADRGDAGAQHLVRPGRRRGYFQVYAETFDQRFFFEIVQRRGYRGYGAGSTGQAGRAGAIVRRSPLMFQPAHWEELFHQGYTTVSGAMDGAVLQAAQATAAR